MYAPEHWSSSCRTYWTGCCSPDLILSSHDLEIGRKGHSRSLKMVSFDRSYTTFYWSAIVSIALCCTNVELFDVE